MQNDHLSRRMVLSPVPNLTLLLRLAVAVVTVAAALAHPADHVAVLSNGRKRRILGGTRWVRLGGREVYDRSLPRWVSNADDKSAPSLHLLGGGACRLPMNLIIGCLCCHNALVILISAFLLVCCCFSPRLQCSGRKFDPVLVFGGQTSILVLRVRRKR